MKDIIIIGGSDAGISAALRIKELSPKTFPVIITSDSFPNFSICGLPYYISHEVSHWKNLAHRTIEEIKNQGIKLLLNRHAQSVNVEEKHVKVLTKNGGTKYISYDKLIIGTGALSLKPNIPGQENNGVFFLRWVPESLAIDEFLEKKKPNSAIIVGGGYIGMEMSEALMKRGIGINIVEFANSIFPSVDPEFGMKIKDSLIQKGVNVYNNISIESIKSVDDKLLVKGTNNFEVITDLVLIAAGSIPNTELGRSIGMDTGIKGAFKINPRMETGIPDVYAAGDCVETWHRLLKRNTYLPLGTVAHKQGRVAGENAIGGKAEYTGTLGTQSVKIFDNVVARTGLNEKEAITAGYDPVSADIETWDHKKYYPPAEKIYIKVTADRMTGRILGAQMLGAYKTEVSKRIDIFSVALYHDMTLKEFSNYDLSYTPPLSSPWDPVQMAVQLLEKKIKIY